jgi:hypothetical protein
MRAPSGLPCAAVHAARRLASRHARERVRETESAARVGCGGAACAPATRARTGPRPTPAARRRAARHPRSMDRPPPTADKPDDRRTHTRLAHKLTHSLTEFEFSLTSHATPRNVPYSLRAANATCGASTTPSGLSARLCDGLSARLCDGPLRPPPRTGVSRRGGGRLRRGRHSSGLVDAAARRPTRRSSLTCT